jgi:hypothetical protein
MRWYWRTSPEHPLGTDHAKLVALRVGGDGPRLGAGLPDVHPPSTKGKDALDLGLLLARIEAATTRSPRQAGPLRRRSLTTR